MNFRSFAGLAALMFLTSCGEDAEVVVNETRRVTLRDIKSPKLNASSDERFRNTLPSPVEAKPPAGWLSLPPTEFRLLNYRFGDQGRGECWVSVASGGLLDNLNRWRRQFGAEPIDAAALSDLPRVAVGAEQQGVWVEATGTYTPGMGQPPRSDQALAGIIVDAQGRLLTIKMVGPIAEVEAQSDALKAFAASMVWRD